MTKQAHPFGLRSGLHRSGIAALLLTGLLGMTATAGPREQARRMHDRIAGVPPTAAVLDTMEAQISAGNASGAAFTAMDNAAFYNVTLKNLAAPWTNRDRSVFVPLNDYIATVVGMVRDDVPFNTLLSADLVYVGRSGLGLPPYRMTDNAHYEDMEATGLDLADALVGMPQSALTDLPASATAGVMTTRAAAEAFFVAGTNRAMFRFTVLNHFCDDLEQLRDTTRPPDRIRQDVTRSPGGDSRIFLNNCIGCHSGMDPMAQAFAYYQFDQDLERLVYTPGTVQPKYFINGENFRYGYVTPDDRWDNYWRQGPNALLGWSDALTGSGNGAKSLGLELENSEAFAHCQVRKVFRNVCFRDPVDAPDRSAIDGFVDSFVTGGYRLKQVFADSAVYCMGD